MKFIKPLLTASISLSLLQLSTAQDEPKKEVAKEKTDVEIKREKINEAFSNLPEAKRITYLKGRQEAQRLFSKKRTFETLMELYKIEEIFPNDPIALNVLGAVHVEFRDFEYARTIFAKALELSGNDPKILFNIAEIEFCANQWKACIEKFENLIKTIDSPKSHFVHIMEFKVLLSYLALASEDTADKDKYLEKAKELMGNHTFMEDTPYSYYAKASVAYFEKDETKAGEWLKRAKIIFGAEFLLSWDDTLVEFGYIKSHYGLHYSKSSRNDKSPTKPEENTTPK